MAQRQLPVGSQANPAGTVQALKNLGSHTDDRQLAAKYKLGNNRAQHQNLVWLFQYQGRRPMAVQYYFQQHAATSTGTSAVWDGQHLARDDLST